MARGGQAEEVDWTAVIGRALAFLCVRQADLEKATLVEQADFLERFGIPRAQAADILGTTPKSLSELDRRRKAPKASQEKTSVRKKTTKKNKREANRQ
ncbi:MAG: hypothetical protein M3285_11360 [Actinomycetota bacterium]|nr:hypothetical protein [Actinomycetota bacterium]